MTTPARGFEIEPCTEPLDSGWLALRSALWPDEGAAGHLAEMAQLLAAGPLRCVQFVARAAGGAALGLAEAALRLDHVNGTNTSPVVFLEGLYVVSAARRAGIARALVAAVAQWGRERGCAEFASDTPLDNTASQGLFALRQGTAL